MAKQSPVSAFLRKVNGFQKTADTFSNKFNDIVKESVRLLWEHENINVINRVIEVSAHIKGIDRRALASYYRECVPFHWNNKEYLFKAPEGEKAKDSKKVKAMKGKWEAYIESTNWYDLSAVKKPKPYIFEVEKLVDLVHSRLQKAHDNGQLSTGKLASAKAKLDQEINTFMKVEGARHEGDKKQQGAKVQAISSKKKAVAKKRAA